MADLPKLYLDEDVYQAVAVGLRRRGFDVKSTAEAGRQGATDEEQLQFASSERRAIFTFNRGNFARLHGDWLSEGRRHCGIVVSPQVGVGAVVRCLSRLLADRDAAWLADRLLWLQLDALDQ